MDVNRSLVNSNPYNQGELGVTERDLEDFQDLERIIRFYLNDNPCDANNSAAKEAQVVQCGPVYNIFALYV